MSTLQSATGVARAALLISLMIAVSAVAGCAVAADKRTAASSATTSAPRVIANGETLVGTAGTRYREVASFKGIPYAAPPVGALRWQAPQPHKAQPGARSAQSFAAGCYQDDYNTQWYRRVGAAFGAAPGVFQDPPFSEDCLYLNVWTPALRSAARLPVIVWIHGGSNKAGWSFEPNYVGENLAARGKVVVVTIGYRLGVFGYFGHPQLRGTAAPTNFGLLDQIAALQWVQRNIRAFGGDPANVTVAGESAGASDLGYLMISPMARGLFKRGISQSGGFHMQDAQQLADVESVGIKLARALPGTPNLAGMRALNSAELFSAGQTALAGHDYRPAVDGISLLKSPALAYRQDGLPYDLLIGTNENEWYMYGDGDPAKLAANLQTFPPAARDTLTRRAARETDDKHGNDKVFTIVNMICSSYLMADRVDVPKHRAWVYRFTRVRPGPGGRQLLAYHGAEIPYVFDSHDDWFSSDSTEVRLTTTMLTYWTNFARTGDPNGPGLPRWPRYSLQTNQVMALGDQIKPISGPDAELCPALAAELYPGWQP